MKAQNVVETAFSNGKLMIPRGYRSFLNLRETEEAIKFIKDSFEARLAERLNLTRVSAPVAVWSKSGLNDYLTGVEKPVSFSVKGVDEHAEVVQSLAKWKRLALAEYSFKHGEGLYTDMNAIRPDEQLDNLHSIYVDQWDWERIINPSERNLDFLKFIVRELYAAIKEEEDEVCRVYKKLPTSFLPESISFIHSQDLEDRFPDTSPAERENIICREMKAVFIIGIGARLKSGRPHDERAADYDDWSTDTGNGRNGLNGDILIWYPQLACAFELSSMGIRVDKGALLAQLEIKEESHKADLYFHQKLLRGELPLSIGGGVGQSRLCMLYLRKAHIGEVQSGLWPDEMLDICKANRFSIL